MKKHVTEKFHLIDSDRKENIYRLSTKRRIRTLEDLLYLYLSNIKRSRFVYDKAVLKCNDNSVVIHYTNHIITEFRNCVHIRNSSRVKIIYEMWLDSRRIKSIRDR